jgi:hypothetical protein
MWRSKIASRVGLSHAQLFNLFGCVVVILAHYEAAVGATIDSDTTIDANNSFPGERVEVIDGLNPPTVVSIVEGGEVGTDLVVRGSSIVNVFGGIVGEDVSLFDAAHLTLHEGALEDDVLATDSAKLIVLGGRILESVIASGGSRVSVFDEATMEDVRASGFSTVEIFGGTFVNDGATVSAEGESTINIHGGSFESTETGIHLGIVKK